MAMNPQGSEAYDLSLFENKKPTIVEVKPNKKQQMEQKRHARIQTFLNAVTTLFVAAVAVTVIALMIAGRVRLTEMNTEINTLQDQLSALQSETVTLKNELAANTSAESVEQYAAANGMQKTEAHQQKYISVGGGDKIETPVEDVPWYAALAEWVNDLFQ